MCLTSRLAYAAVSQNHSIAELIMYKIAIPCSSHPKIRVSFIVFDLSLARAIMR